MIVQESTKSSSHFGTLRVCALPVQGLDHVMFVAASGTKLLLRQYSIGFKKSGTTTPRTELTEMGPRIDFTVRRTRPAPEELHNQSMKQAKTEKKKVRTVA